MARMYGVHDENRKTDPWDGDVEKLRKDEVFHKLLPLISARGEWINIQCAGRRLEVASKAYQIDDHRGTQRQVFVMRGEENGRNVVVACVDVGINWHEKRAVCHGRSKTAPTELGRLSEAGPEMDGLAVRNGDEEIRLVMLGIAIATLEYEGARDFTLVEEKMDSGDDDAYSSRGCAPTSDVTTHFVGATPEIRALVAESLGVTPEY